MVTRLDALFAHLGLMIIIAVLDFVALEKFLFWEYWWFDIVLHFLGGAAVAAAFLWFVLNEFPSELRSRYSGILPTLGVVFTVGVLWEVFEVYFGLQADSTVEVWMFDTGLDLVMDLIGGIAVLVPLHVMKKQHG